MLVCGACSTPTTLTDASAVAGAIGHVRPSKGDSCATQAAVAAQSSRIDTIIKGKETVYKPAPCKAAPSGGKIAVEPKTS